MSFKKFALVMAVGALSVPAAFADGGIKWVGGEVGFEFPMTQGTKSRAEVMQELAAFRANPVAADGWRYVDAQVGFVTPIATYAFNGGKLTRTDEFDRTTPASGFSLAQESRRGYEAYYLGS